MATIFLANSEIYVVASNMDQAVEKYYENKSTYPTTMITFKGPDYTLTESTVAAITPVVLPAGAVTAGCTVIPDTVAYIKEGDQITLTATGAGAYPTFVNWTDSESAVLSTDNPYTYTATASDITINGNFSA